MGDLIFAHGGYKKLKSFQIARLVYDLTVIFADHYIDSKSRTKDQMVQAARSGVQNIAEGSLASGTSKKTEIKLTNVARASLEELKLDYEDFLRQNQLLQWACDDPQAENLIAQRCQNADEVRNWVNLQAEILKNACGESRTREIAANAILVLIRVAISLLEKQLSRLAQEFTQAGGFTERLYSVRKEERANQRIKSRFDD